MKGRTLVSLLLLAGIATAACIPLGTQNGFADNKPSCYSQTFDSPGYLQAWSDGPEVAVSCNQGTPPAIGAGKCTFTVDSNEFYTVNMNFFPARYEDSAAECTPGETVCIDGKLRSCFEMAEGTVFIEGGECDVCSDSCEPGALRCFSGNVYRCQGTNYCKGWSRIGGDCGEAGEGGDVSPGTYRSGSGDEGWEGELNYSQMAGIPLEFVNGTLNISNFEAYSYPGFSMLPNILSYDASLLVERITECDKAPEQSMELNKVRATKSWIDQEKSRWSSMCTSLEQALAFGEIQASMNQKKTMTGTETDIYNALRRCDGIKRGFYILDNCLNDKLDYSGGTFNLKEYSEFSQTDICKITAKRNPAANAVIGVGESISRFGADVVEVDSELGVQVFKQGKKDFAEGGLGWITGGAQMFAGAVAYGIGQVGGGAIEGTGGMVSGTAHIGNMVGCATSVSAGATKKGGIPEINTLNFLMEEDLHDTLGYTGGAIARHFTEDCVKEPLRCVGEFLPAIALGMAMGGPEAVASDTVATEDIVLSDGLALLPTQVGETTVYTTVTHAGEIATAAGDTFTTIPGVITTTSGLATTAEGETSLTELGVGSLNRLWILNSRVGTLGNKVILKPGTFEYHIVPRHYHDFVSKFGWSEQTLMDKVLDTALYGEVRQDLITKAGRIAKVGEYKALDGTMQQMVVILEADGIEIVTAHPY